jgi:hypothetical protein
MGMGAGQARSIKAVGDKIWKPALFGALTPRSFLGSTSSCSRQLKRPYTNHTNPDTAQGALEKNCSSIVAWRALRRLMLGASLVKAGVTGVQGRSAAAKSTKVKARSVLFADGGLSTIDTFDLSRCSTGMMTQPLQRINLHQTPALPVKSPHYTFKYGQSGNGRQRHVAPTCQLRRRRSVYTGDSNHEEPSCLMGGTQPGEVTHWQPGAGAAA